MMANQLNIITGIVKFSAKVDLYEIRGIKDTEWKIWACFLAKKLTKLPDAEIADFFNIYKNYMVNRLEDFTVQLLFDNDAKEVVEDLSRLYMDITANEYQP